MKVLMGTFVTESNANVPAKTRINHYDMAFGEDCLRKMNVADIYACLLYTSSLTGGATPQDTASIPFKRIQRPMFPIDEI